MSHTAAATDNHHATDALIYDLTGEEMVEHLRACGYRAHLVEQDNLVQIQSAAQGMSFTVGRGNSATRREQAYVDFLFHCPLTVEGELPERVIQAWNQQKRFARLFSQGPMLVMGFDLMLAGGVTPDWVRGQCNLWDHLIAELSLFLKQQLSDTPSLAPQQPAPDDRAGETP